MQYISTREDSGVAIITFLDSKGGNRLNPQFLEALLNTLKSYINRIDIRAIVIQSNGSNFCLGMDLLSLESLGNVENTLKKAVADYTQLLSVIFKAAKPIICLINGAVKAGGVGFVAACDIVLATERASFELSEVLLGLIPANVLPYLYIMRLSPLKTRYLAMTAKLLDAKQALQLGLVDEVFTVAAFESGVRKVLKQLMRCAPAAIKKLKNFTVKFIDKNFAERKKLAIDTLLDLVKSKHVKQAISAFNNGAVPSWFSRFKPQQSITYNNQGD